MKKLVMALSLACVSFVANAGDVCANLPGQWSGNGRMVFQVDSIDKTLSCYYSGLANITSKNGKTSRFTADVTLTLLSGICPAMDKSTLTGNCEQDGDIYMTSDDRRVNLKGSLKKNGKVGYISGTIRFEVKGQVVKGSLDRTVVAKNM